MTQALFDALHHPGVRVWNPWTRSMVRAEIKDRLVMASRGQLVPIEHVKELRGGRGDLFEIRWQGIAVTDYVNGSLTHYKMNLRLAHAEPLRHSVCVVGLVVVEKPNDSTADAIHETAICEAERYFSVHYDNDWGITFPAR